MEALHLAAGLRVVGPGVLERDAEGGQVGLQCGAPAGAGGVPDGEDHPIVGEHRGGQGVGGEGSAETVTHGHGGEHRAGGAGDRLAGVVIDDVEDLDMGLVGQPPVGDVGLPAFVGLLGLEADVAATGPFTWLRGDEPAAAQHLVDRRHRGSGAGLLAQVAGDGDRPGVQALLGQLFAQLDDALFDPDPDLPGIAARTAGARLQTRLALIAVTGQQRVDPGPGDPIVPGDLTDRPVLDHNSSNDQAGLGHEDTSRPLDCPLCLETSVLDVNESETLSSTLSSTKLNIHLS